MDSFKKSLIVSVIISGPIFVIVPFTIYIYSNVLHRTIDSEVISYFLRVIALLFVFFLIVKVYKDFIIVTLPIKENGFRIMIFLYIIPAVVIGNCFGMYIAFMPKIELALNFNINEYSDFLSKIEKNMPLMISVVLLVLWWGRNTGGSRK